MKTCHQLTMIFLRLFIVALIAEVGSSCTFLDTINATPSSIILTETPLPTSTIAWFPPSVTPSPQAFSTFPPTPEMRPGLSTILVTDEFFDNSLWDIAASDQGSAAFGDNQLTLAAQSKVYMISLRHELVLQDFYAEITARTSLCRENDSYGILVRANNAAYMRFTLSCIGTTGAERISPGKRQLIQAPIPSGDVPPGAPGEVRIGIWVVGGEMRLFLNGHFQFSISEANLASGTFGVFVNSGGDTPVIVSFSDLNIQKVNYSFPINTPKP